MLFFFNDTATTEIYTLSLHDALPISGPLGRGRGGMTERGWWTAAILALGGFIALMLLIGNLGPAREDVDPLTVTEVLRSEEHTSELQSRQYIVCRLLLEKKKNMNTT